MHKLVIVIFNKLSVWMFIGTALLAFRKLSFSHEKAMVKFSEVIETPSGISIVGTTLQSRVESWLKIIFEVNERVCCNWVLDKDMNIG